MNWKIKGTNPVTGTITTAKVFSATEALNVEGDMIENGYTEVSIDPSE